MSRSLSPDSTPAEKSPYRFGLVGYPLGHSLSPGIHAAALQSLGLQGEYELFPVPPNSGGEAELVRRLESVRAGEVHGLNVTIPHKQKVIPLLDDLSPAAGAIGAVNTIFQQDGNLIGDNTDAPGFWADLNNRLDLKLGAASRVLILGAGGSARAAAYALLKHDFYVTIAARRIGQAQALCDHLSVYSRRLSVLDLDLISLWESASLRNQGFESLENHSPYSLIVNATPVGMYPHIQASPWPLGVPFPENVSIYDLVYNPPETLLVKHARADGLPAVTGLGMLVEQAALAFERWTGLSAPRDIMMAAAQVEK
jgi:shikimate dehydrogenase